MQNRELVELFSSIEQELKRISLLLEKMLLAMELGKKEK